MDNDTKKSQSIFQAPQERDKVPAVAKEKYDFAVRDRERARVLLERLKRAA